MEEGDLEERTREQLIELWRRTKNLEFIRTAVLLRKRGTTMDAADIISRGKEFQKPGRGRPKLDGGDHHITEMAFLIVRGKARDPADAARIVARRIGGQSVESTATRLAKAYRPVKQKAERLARNLVNDLERQERLETQLRAQTAALLAPIFDVPPWIKAAHDQATAMKTLLDGHRAEFDRMAELKAEGDRMNRLKEEIARRVGLSPRRQDGGENSSN